MAVKQITSRILELTCEKPDCGNVWHIPRTRRLPLVCHKCKTTLWNNYPKAKKQTKTCRVTAKTPNEKIFATGEKNT